VLGVEVDETLLGHVRDPIGFFHLLNVAALFQAHGVLVDLDLVHIVSCHSHRGIGCRRGTDFRKGSYLKENHSRDHLKVRMQMLQSVQGKYRYSG